MCVWTALEGPKRTEGQEMPGISDTELECLAHAIHCLCTDSVNTGYRLFFALNLFIVLWVLIAAGLAIRFLTLSAVIKCMFTNQVFCLHTSVMSNVYNIYARWTIAQQSISGGLKYTKKYMYATLPQIAFHSLFTLLHTYIHTHYSPSSMGPCKPIVWAHNRFLISVVHVMTDALSVHL